MKKLLPAFWSHVWKFDFALFVYTWFVENKWMNDCNPLRCIGLKAHWLLVEFMAPVIAWQYRLHSQNALILKKSRSLLIAIQQTNLISVHLSIAGLIYGTWDDKYTVSKNKRWTTKTWRWRQTNIYIYKALWFSKERRIGNVDGIFYKIWPGARTIRTVLYIHILTVWYVWLIDCVQLLKKYFNKLYIL